MTSPLSSELNKYELFREKLKAEFPDTDEETLADTLEGMTDLTDMIAATLRSANEDKAMMDGLSDYITALQVRGQRIGERWAKKRALCLDAMERANIKTIKEPDFTASLRSTPQKVVIVDEAKIPREYFNTPTLEETAVFAAGVLDKRDLLAAIKVGRIAGVVLSNPARTISIRTK